MQKEDSRNAELPEQRSPIFFSKVEATFQITGRGCVVVPALPRPDLDFRLRVNSLIQLRSPGGQVRDTYLAGIEMVCGQAVSCRIAFLLPQNVTQDDVSKGTEIWLIQEP